MTHESLSPNPRLQRTRSAPLRSPLSRKPLGGAREAVVFCVIAAALATGCASARQNSRLSISIVDTVGGYPIPNIEIVATAKATGQKSHGTTDPQGRVSFPGLAAGLYSLESPTLGGGVFIPDHVRYLGGVQEIRVKTDLRTDKKGVYVGPGSAA